MTRGAGAPHSRLTPVDGRGAPARIADQLRALVVDGTYRPGLRLGEAAVAQQLGVSRGPVREAMARLVQEGLLVDVPNRGVFVVELGPADVADVYAARAVVERHAAERVRRARDGGILDRLDALVNEMATLARRRGPRAGRDAALAAADLAFHQALVTGAGSARLSRMFATLAAETMVCLSALADAYPDPAEIVAEHRLVVDTLRAGTSRDVARVLDDHFATAVHHLAGQRDVSLGR